MHKLKGIHIVILTFATLLIVVACAPEVRHSVLSTIFDGVPPMEDQALTIAKDSLGQVDSTRFLAAANALGKSINYHSPYKEKDCASCHDQQHMGKLVAKEPQLCYQCHDQTTEKYSYKHGPAEAGYCTSCHRPHLAETENLLLNEKDDLCFNCHDNERIAENAIHKNIKNESCVECHNPHSSENRSMLQSEACYSCHEDKTEDYTFLHGPVSGNYCATCHESHTSKNKNLLVQSDQKLCLSCHNSSIMSVNKEHLENKNENCISCHDPHGGENKFMLN